VSVTAPTGNYLVLDPKLALDVTLPVTNFAAPSYEMAAVRRVGHGQTLGDDSPTAQSHTESHSATHSNIPSDEDHGQGHDHEPPTVKDVAITEDRHAHAH